MLDADMLDDVVLYDIMYEAGTRLGGAMSDLFYLAMKQDDKEEMDRWLTAQQKLQLERAAIPTDDRQAQIDAYDRWVRRAQELSRVLDARTAADGQATRKEAGNAAA